MSDKKQKSIGWTDEQLRARGFIPDGQGGYKKQKIDALDPVEKTIKQLNESSLSFPGTSKYNNKKTIVAGHKFDSLKESRRYLELLSLEQSGSITNLKLQQKFKIEINGFNVCTYIADFTYYKNTELIVEDVKGMKTAIYNLKKKLLKAVLNIDIKEV